MSSVPQIDRSVMEKAVVPNGFNQIISLGTARGLGYGLTSDAIPAESVFALIQAEGDIRWRDDGTNPTATIGMLLADGDSIWYTGSDLTKMKLITNGSQANISFYKA